MEHLPGAAGPTAPLEPSSVILYLSFMEIRMGTRSTPLVSEIGLVQTAHSRVHLGGVPTVSVTGATQRLSFPRHQSPGTPGDCTPGCTANTLKLKPTVSSYETLLPAHQAQTPPHQRAKTSLPTVQARVTVSSNSYNLTHHPAT